MPLLTKNYTFTAHTTAKAGEVNSDFDQLFDTFNSFPAGTAFPGLYSFSPFVFHRVQELYVNAKLFPAFRVTTAFFYGTSVLDYAFIHQGNTTKGVTTLLLKRKRSGVDTTLATITVPDGTAPYTAITGTFTADVGADGDTIWLDCTAVGAVAPAAVTVYTVFRSQVGS